MNATVLDDIATLPVTVRVVDQLALLDLVVRVFGHSENTFPRLVAASGAARVLRQMEVDSHLRDMAHKNFLPVIKHHLTNYDQLWQDLKARHALDSLETGTACALLTQRINEAIAARYPFLARQCAFDTSQALLGKTAQFKKEEPLGIRLLPEGLLARLKDGKEGGG